MAYKYKAFISYRHHGRDARAAVAIQEMIERYILPVGIGSGKRRVGKVFRDESELSASHDLPETIHQALDDSEFLIVVCSDRSVESRWVPSEINYFLKNHGPEKILPVFVSGDATQVIPVILPMLNEPLYIDLSAGDEGQMLRELRNRFPKLCAPLAGCDYDDLIMRDQKRRRRRLLSMMMVIAAVSSIVIGSLFWSYLRVEDKNKELAQQNTEILRRESNILALESQQYLADGDLNMAIQYAVDALPKPGEERPYIPQAEQVLFDALDLYSGFSLIKESVLIERNTPVEDYCFSADGSLLVTVDHYGLVNCYDSANGSCVWSVMTETTYSTAYRLMMAASGDYIMLIAGNDVMAFDLSSGENMWAVEYAALSSRESVISAELSPDGSFLVLTRRSLDTLDLVTISATDGTVLNCFPVAYEEEDISISPVTYDAYAFSSDGVHYAGAYLARTNGVKTTSVFLTDLTTGQVRTVFSGQMTSYDGILALEFSQDDQALVILTESEDPRKLAAVEKYQISDGTLLWRSEIDLDANHSKIFFTGNVPSLFCQPDHILVSYRDILYGMDLETGELLCEKRFPSPFVYLRSIQDDRYVFLLEDGTYDIGWLNDYGLHYFEWKIPCLQLGKIEGAELYRDGYLRLQSNEEFIEGLYVGTPDEGYGHLAVIRPGGRQIEIVRTKEFLPELKHKEILRLESEEEHLWLREVRPIDERTVALIVELENDRFGITLVDRETLEIRAQYEIEGDFYETDIYFISDGTRYMYRDYDHIYLCDGSGGTHSIIDRSEELQFQSGNVQYQGLSGYNVKLGRVHATGEVMIVQECARGLKLWLNETEQADVPYPDELVRTGWFHDLVVGRNGYIFVNLKDENCPDYLLYSTQDQKWIRIPMLETEKDVYRASLGTTSEYFAVMDSHGSVRVFDLSDETMKMQFDLSMPANSIKTFKWVLDDRYLAVSDRNGLIVLVEPSTGEIYYLDDLTSGYSGEFDFAMNADGTRMYIWSETGICVDLPTFTRIASFGNISFYDPISDMIYFDENMYGETTNIFTVRAVQHPSMERLVELATVYLGE